jgi:hypothetical protein
MHERYNCSYNSTNYASTKLTPVLVYALSMFWYCFQSSGGVVQLGARNEDVYVRAFDIIIIY